MASSQGGNEVTGAFQTGGSVEQTKLNTPGMLWLNWARICRQLTRQHIFACKESLMLRVVPGSPISKGSRWTSFTPLGVRVHLFVHGTAATAVHITSQKPWWCKSVLALWLRPVAEMLFEPESWLPLAEGGKQQGNSLGKGGVGGLGGGGIGNEGAAGNVCHRHWQHMTTSQLHCHCL